MKYTPKLIPLETDGNYIQYPVGANIQLNMPIIFKYVAVIEKEFPGKKINLICRGSSGAIIGGIIASLIKDSRITFVRKNGGQSHGSNVHKIRSSDINIIVDDFFVTGSTLLEISKSIMKNYPSGVHIDLLMLTNQKNIIDDIIDATNHALNVTEENTNLIEFFTQTKPSMITYI